MRILVLAIVFLACTGGRAGAEIYKWVDANGTVHFSDRPVADQQAEVVDAPPLQTYQESAAPAIPSVEKRVKNYLAEQEREAARRRKAAQAEARRKAAEQRQQQLELERKRERLKQARRAHWYRQQQLRRLGIGY